MKPVIVGMNNPYSVDPKYALYPHPTGSAGHRLFEMLRAAGNRMNIKVTPLKYVDAFDRINLLNETKWDPAKAKSLSPAVLAYLKGRTVVLCGKSSANILGMQKVDFGTTPKFDTYWDFSYYVIPHPSGLCREYNDPATVRSVGDLLLELYVRS